LPGTACSAYCLAEQGNPILADHIETLVIQAVEALGPESPYLLRHVLTDLSLSQSQGAVSLARRLFDDLDTKALDAITAAELLRHLPRIRGAVLARARDQSRTRSRRFDDYERVLRASVNAGDATMAEQALDEMEGLARSEPEQTHFLQLLNDPSRHGNVWDADEVDYARVRLHEFRGEVEEARAVLNRLGHRLLSTSESYAVTAAAGVVERVRHLGVEPDPRLLARLAAVQTQEEQQEPIPNARIEARILFVGGGESERNNARAVEKWIEESWPNIELEFEHPNWSSNWGPQLRSLKGRIAKADAVVLMPLVRTHLGRGVRKMCGENGICWVPCTGKGQHSMRMAIEHAVRVIASGNHNEQAEVT